MASAFHSRRNADASDISDHSVVYKKGRGCLRKLKTENPTSYHTEYKRLRDFASLREVFSNNRNNLFKQQLQPNFLASARLASPLRAINLKKT